MDKKKSILRMLRNFKTETENKISIKKMFLFGSMASGDYHRWSDIDLLIVSDEFKKLKFRERATKMYDYWNTDHPVDFLCYTPEEFEKLKKQVTIVREAVREGIEI